MKVVLVNKGRLGEPDVYVQFYGVDMDTVETHSYGTKGGATQRVDATRRWTVTSDPFNAHCWGDKATAKAFAEAKGFHDFVPVDADVSFPF